MTDISDKAPAPGAARAPVAAARCADYELESVRAALREVLAPLGGMTAFVKPGERIALKPNLLMAAAPERAIATHPVVVAAVALEVMEAGAHPVVVESPGTGTVHVKAVMERVFRRAGYTEMAQRHGFELSLDMDYQTVSCPDAVFSKRFEVMTPILQADGVINLAKLKTHMFMIFTGATKNLFGVIPGLNKASYHARLADPQRFANMLLDLAYFVRPRLSIVDGVLAMEGDGPGTSGRPKQLGVLLAGADPVHVDVACCRIAGIDPAKVPVLLVARERGLWSGREEDAETLGTQVAALQVTDFVKPAGYQGIGVGGTSGTLDGPLRLVLRRFNRVPRPKVGRCTICASCERACPVKAISIDKAAGRLLKRGVSPPERDGYAKDEDARSANSSAIGATENEVLRRPARSGGRNSVFQQPPMVARVDDSLCIRCYCCHEVCPEAAIDLEFTGMGRVMHRLRLL